MTTTNKSSVLKDVVAFVDVWSSEKTANYSKPFIQQLQEMGAQVSKTFNKQVTHVVFNNGHSSTWRKAKKSNVHLVSLLWIGRCYENDVHADEELYPALNDESNPVLKNKRHRCMRPKDSPERRPENDWRMRKKLDKMMKDLPPKQPVATDVSSIFIDEENGIVYSPALKRSDYMARRLKDMKDKRENLSPTASQMTESCSPTGLKPFLGSTPTLPKFLFNESDDESSASVAELDRSPDKEEGRTALHVTDPEHSEQQSRLTDSVKPWLSPLRNDPKRTSSPERQDDEDRHKRKSRRASVKSMKKYGSVGFLENPSPGRRSNNVRNVQKQQSLSAVECESSKCAIAKPFTENLHLDTVKSPRCSSSSAVIDNAAAEASKETPATLQKTELKTPRQAKSSLSALVKSLAVSSEPKGVGAAFADEDEVFDDFFSPANNPQRSKGHLLPNLPVEGSIHIPFELEPVLKKRKQRTSESWGSEGHDKKKKKNTLEKSQKDKTISETFDASSENHHQHQDSLPVLDSSRADATPITKSKRQRSLVSAETGETSSSAQSVDNPVSNLQKNSEMNIMFDALQSRGNECTVAAGFTESSTHAGENDNRQIGLIPEKMVRTTKAVRTLVMTSMPTEKQHLVVQVVKSLGGFSIADRVSESTTHLVSGGDKRTLNILLGIARGCWILSFEWILWCLEQRQWIPEEPYELSDKFPAAQICRLQRHLSAGEHQQDLFQGQPAMFVSQHSQPPTQSLVELIELCGGTVCKTVRQAGICIGKYSGRRPAGSRILSEQWVLDSITHLKLLSYDNYDLE